MTRNSPPSEPVAVIIPAWRNWSSLDDVLTALVPQLRDGDEAVVVESSGDGGAATLQERWPAVRVIASDQQLGTVAARRAGLAATSAPLIVFLDADAVPQPTWLAVLRSSLGDLDAVGGSVLDGTPDNVVGSASYLIQFLRWHPAAPIAPDSLVACNLMIRRSTFESLGGFIGDIWPGEDTLLTYALMRANRARFVAEAAVTHHNRTSFRWLVRHEIEMGQSFAEVCRHGAFRPAALGRRPFAPLTGLLRWLVTMRRAIPHLRGVRRTVALIVLMSVGLAAWSTGILVGPTRRSS